MSSIYPLLLPIFLLLGSLGISESSSNKLYLKDIKVLALHRGIYTKPRHGDSVPQIQCIGGDAMSKMDPAIFFCYYKGHDGLEHNWECNTPTNTSQYTFGLMRVHCEGYDGPNDIHYVLQGSCGLEYTLEYANTIVKNNATDICKKVRSVGWVIGTLLLLFGPVGFMLCMAEVVRAVKIFLERKAQKVANGRTSIEPYKMPERYSNAIAIIIINYITDLILRWIYADKIAKEGGSLNATIFVDE